MSRSDRPKPSQHSSRTPEPDAEEPQPSIRTRKIEELNRFVSRWSKDFQALEQDEFDQPDADLQGDYLIASAPRSVKQTVGQLGDWARAVYEARRVRERLFGAPSLFAEPAWDILLDLARSASAGKRLATTDLCIGSCVPATTALRWIAILEGRGYIKREDDLIDKRRSFFQLTDLGVQMMRRCCTEIEKRQQAGFLFRA